jgi:ABC-type Fe3+/spermidine/putrescine transport system ATPase subunit
MGIEVTGLTKSFGATPVLRSLDLAVPPGGRVAVLGDSGSGKTTLLRLVAGLEVPDAGEIRLGGEPVAGPGLDLPPHRRGVAFCFQFPALWPHMTVVDNVAFGVLGRSRAEARAAAAALLAPLGLAGLGRRYPDQLSGGQAKRVALARALAAGRARLLLDEPLTHVEPALRDELLAFLLDQARTQGATLVYVTHDPAEAEQAAELRWRMHAGRLEPLG